MGDRIQATVTRSRNMNMFAELSHGNWVLLENASKERDGYLYELMSCLVFAAFKHEAFLNHIGSLIIPFWDELERLPHRKKLDVIAAQVGLTIDFGCRPFQTLSELFSARDEFAHGKPELLSDNCVVETGTREELRRKKPLTKWETRCTVEFATRAYDDTEKIAEILWDAAGLNRGELRARGHSYSLAEHSNP